MRRAGVRETPHSAGRGAHFGEGAVTAPLHPMLAAGDPPCGGVRSDLRLGRERPNPDSIRLYDDDVTGRLLDPASIDELAKDVCDLRSGVVRW